MGWKYHPLTAKNLKALLFLIATPGNCDVFLVVYKKKEKGESRVLFSAAYSIKIPKVLK
jgi:hypothetical protein